MPADTVVTTLPTLSAAVSETGKRDGNQDAFFADDTLGLYIVADGVGGRQAGEVASAIAIKTISEQVAQWKITPEANREHPSTFVSRVIQSACATIHREAEQKRELAGMSTTVTMVLMQDDTAVMGHVGDSRMYFLRDGTLEQISTDHSLAAELYRGGVITREGVEKHPHSRVLTRNCGGQPSVLVDTLQLQVRPGDVVLLCSDGLNHGLRQPTWVVEVLDGDDLEHALRVLVDKASAEGSRDNITAVAWRRSNDPPSLASPVIDALRSVPIFSELGLADLARVAAVMTPRNYSKDQVVLHRDEPAAGLHVVLGGRLSWRLDETHFAFLERGAGIGTTTLVAARRCPAELRADTQASVFVLSCEAFRQLIRARPRLGNQLLIALADELSDWIDPDTNRGVAMPPRGLLVEF